MGLAPRHRGSPALACSVIVDYRDELLDLGLPLILRSPSAKQLRSLAGVGSVLAELRWPLELVKTNLSSISIFAMIHLYLPLGGSSSEDFLWKGRKDMHGGHCLVWSNKVRMPK
jgi:hypothetical protein